MGLLNPYFTISDGNSFDIHYMTLALLWLASTCNDKKGIMIFQPAMKRMDMETKKKDQK